MLIEAALGAGPGPGRWTGLRQSMNAAILRGGPQLAKAALGSVIIGEGRIRPTSSSPIRTLAERAGGDWLDDAVLLLMAAACFVASELFWRFSLRHYTSASA
jgi:hypothetical protein